MNRLAARFFGGLSLTARHPWWTLILSIPVLAWAGWQVTQLRPVASLRNITSPEDAAAQALNQIIEEFGITDELMLLVSWPAGMGGDASQIQLELVAFAERLKSSFEQDAARRALVGPIRFRPPPDYREFVEQVMAPHALHYVDDGAALALRERLTPDAMAVQIRRCEQSMAAGGGGVIGRAQIQDILGLWDILGPELAARFGSLPGALSSPISGGGESPFFSKDGRSLLVRIGGQRPVSDLNYARWLSEAVRHRAIQLNTDGLTLTFTGAYPIAAFAERAIRSDMIRSIVIALILLQILFWFAFRDLASFPLAMVPVGCGCLLGFGVYAAWSTELTPMTAAIGAVLAGLGVDYAIHVLSHYRHARREGFSAEAAVRRLMELVGPAMLTACGTSVLGLLVVARSQVPALREFALLGALGLAGSLLATLALLPAMLVIRDRARKDNTNKFDLPFEPHRPPLPANESHRVPRQGLLEFLALRPFDSLPRILAVLFVAVFVIAVWRGWPEVSDDLTLLHPRPNPPLEAQQRVIHEFGGVVDPLLVHLEARSSQDLLALAHVVQRRLVQSEMRELGIANIQSLATWFPDPLSRLPATRFLNDREVGEVLNSFDAALAESLFEPSAFAAYRSFLKQLLSESRSPTPNDLSAYPELARQLLPRGALHESDQPWHSIMTLFVDGSLTNRGRRDEVINTVRTALREFPGATLTGLSVVGHDAEAAIRREVAGVAEPSTAFVLLWVLVYFRRLGATCLAMLPAVAGFAVMIVAMHFLGWKLNMINLIGVAIFAGIGVDNGVLLVSLARLHQGGNGGNAVQEGDWRAALSALSLTTLSTVLSFAALCGTRTPGIQSLGATVAIGMSAAWLASVGVLAPLLRRK